ncbi:transposase [Psychromonas sp. psych-6C06]|uniref:transposase n=1 Tax=Psychromonas sp. psych-6C06 TaxID=2058089 RepID=UPI000C329BBD|nr:transposase [Psychromonas sp. psych-6C06]PKF63510.1 transposase [Psychromonas sp. psych-6C06]
MTQSRDSLISLSDTPYYHCISRCVRRAFLCGQDKYTGQSFEHRRQWVIDRVKYLTDVFPIEVCAYAIMSNHYHLVLFVNEDALANCSDSEICERWCKIYSASHLVQRWQKGKLTSDIENETALDIIAKWRKRLSSISWFMRCLNEFIAVKANKEDKCKGRFWEGRFKSQALLDENALLTCMAYVDLNPIRAKMASSVESSEFTSVFERIHNKTHYGDNQAEKSGKPLVKFIGAEHQHQPAGINFTLIDYLELVDWSGRMIREGKRGVITGQTPALLNTLGLDDETWLGLASDFGKTYHGAVGSLEELALFAEHTGKQWISGKNRLRRIYH